MQYIQSTKKQKHSVTQQGGNEHDGKSRTERVAKSTTSR